MEDDEHITIDFSKITSRIKSVFKGKADKPDTSKYDNENIVFEKEREAKRSTESEKENKKESDDAVKNKKENDKEQEKKEKEKQKPETSREEEKDEEDKTNDKKKEKKYATHIAEKTQNHKKKKEEVISEVEDDDENNEDDDEIGIDFTAIKNKIAGLFSGAGKQKKEKQTEVEEYDDDSEEEGFSINTDKAYSFAKKYWHYIGLLLIIIFVVYMRSQTSYAPVTEDWARNSVHNYFLNQIKADIERQNPNLPEQNKQVLINQQLDEFLKQNKDNIDQQVKEVADQYRKAISYEHEGKYYVFLGDIDSYYWLRFAKNIVDHGDICDEIIDGKCWDKLAFAPLGREDVPNIHPYMIAATYKGARIFGFDIPLMQAALITPTVIAIFVAIAAFFVGYLLVGKIGGLVTSLLLSCNSMYVQRSLGSDNDIYNLLFPLIVLAFLFLSIQAKEKKKMCIYAIISGLFVGFFKFAWESGWWNIFNTVLYSFIIYIGFLLVYGLYKHKSLKKAIQNPVFINSLIIVVLFYFGSFAGFFAVTQITGVGMGDFWRAPLGPLTFIKFAKSAVNLNIWPNVKTTVAEFNAIPLQQVPRQLFIGNLSRVFFFLGVLGIFILFLDQITKKKKRYFLVIASVIAALVFSTDHMLSNISNIAYFGLLGLASFSFLMYIIYKKLDIDLNKQHHLLTGIILTVWFLGTLYASTKGIRFTMLVVPTIAIAIGASLDIIYRKVIEFFRDQDIGKSLIIVKVVVLAIILIVPLTVANDSLKVSRTFVPHYNAAWHTSLTKIKEESKPDAIVNSWWDFGHWFKYTTERGVTLDGATQNSPQLHWLGKLLLTDSELQSRGILRMLDCGGNNAFDILVNTTKDVPVAVDIINEIIILDDKEKVRKILTENKVTKEDIDKLLSFSHCDAPENYLITSDDMISKSGVWAHFGSWNFYRAEIASMKLAGESKEKIILNLTNREYRNSTKKEIEMMYSDLAKKRTQDEQNSWIAPWPTYASDPIGCRKDAESLIWTCDNGLRFDEENDECFINTPEGRMHPKNCLYVDKDGEVQLREYDDRILDIQGRILGVAMYPTGENEMRAVMMDPALTGSMFTRLFYMNGHGLKYFDLFEEQSSQLGTRIYVWKVDWEGKDKIDVYAKPVIEEDTTKEDDENQEIKLDEEETVLNDKIEDEEDGKNSEEEKQEDSKEGQEVSEEQKEDSESQEPDGEESI